MYLEACLEMTTLPLTVKQENDTVPADLENMLHSKVEIKEEFWHQDYATQPPGSILQTLLMQNVSDLSTLQSTSPTAVPRLLEPPPLIFFSEKKHGEILSSQHGELPLPAVSFHPPIPPTLLEPPPLVFFSQTKRAAALSSHELGSSQELRSASSQRPPRSPQKPNSKPTRKSHDHSKIHYCQHCDFRSPCSGTLYSHCVRKHRTFRFECEQCKKKFSTSHKLRRHLTTHQLPDRSVIHFCLECNFSTHSPDTLRSHKTLKHRSPKFECDYCKKMFPLKSKLKQHMDMHINDPQMCKICDRWYKNHTTLDRHSWKYHKTKHLFCNFPACNKSYVQLIALEKHKMIHITSNLPLRQKVSMFRCKHCAVGFPTKSSLTKHVRSTHAQEIKSTRKSLVYQCDHCQKILSRKVALRQHISHEHLQNVRLYNCPYCDFTTTHRSGVCLHKARKHGSRKFECYHCKKLFPIKQDLQVHITNNHNIVLQDCEICGRQYKSRTILKYHHMTKHADRPFKDESQRSKKRTLRQNSKSKSATVKKNVKPSIATRKSLRLKQKILIVPAKMNPVVLLTRITLPLKKNKKIENINLKNAPPPSPGDFEYYSMFTKEEILQEDPVKISPEFDGLEASPPSPGNFEFLTGSIEEEIQREEPMKVSTVLSDLEIALQMAVSSFTPEDDTEVPSASFTVKQENIEVPPTFSTMQQEIETPATFLEVKQEPLEITPTSTALEQDYMLSTVHENACLSNVKIKEEFWVDDYTVEPVGNDLEEPAAESSQASPWKRCSLPQKCNRDTHRKGHLLPCQCNHRPYSFRVNRSQFVTCEFCQRILISRKVLLQHIREKHFKYCDQLRCKYCDFETLCRQSLRSHTLRKHLSHKFKCDHCNKRFPVKMELHRHIAGCHFADENKIFFAQNALS